MSELGKVIEELERLWQKTKPKGWFVETRDANGNGKPVNTLDDEYCKIHRSVGAHAETVSCDFEADDGSPDVAELVCLLVNNAPTLIAAAKRAEEAEAEVGRLRTAIARALNDSETGDCWGPDVTVAGYLREALTPPPTANEGATV